MSVVIVVKSTFLVIPCSHFGGLLHETVLEDNDFLLTKEEPTTIGAMRGVTVSTSAFLACHQCCCAGSSLG